MFRYAAISELTRDRLTERWSRLPRELHPVLLGSGELALPVDATGMQGLNSRKQQFRETMSFGGNSALSADQLYLYRDEALSEHHDSWASHPPFPLGNGQFSLLPCGWLDYRLEVDDECYDAPRIAAEARDWARTFSPRSGILETSFTLGPVRLTITAGLAPGRVEADYRFALAAADDRPHRLAVTVRCHLSLRGGRPLATGGVTTSCDATLAFRSWQASTATSSARVLRPIEISWAIAVRGPARYAVEDDAITARWEATGTTGEAWFRIVSGSDRDGTQTRDYAVGRAAAWQTEDGLAAVAAAWQAYHAAGAEIWIGDPVIEYLTLMQQYVLRAGTPWHSGIPLGTLWHRGFMGATFWDSFFAADGMLRSGHVAEVREFCTWLVKSSPPTGRPHYWMTWYDGTPCSTGDKAYQVCLAYGQVCVRLYEHTRDATDLRERVFPYLRRLAAYLLDEVLVCANGRWQLQGEVAGDIDAAATSAAKESGMLAWVVACLAKCADYAAILGVEDDVTRQCRAVDEFFRAHPIDLSQPGLWGEWYGYLTGLGPHQDLASYRQYCVRSQLNRRFEELTFQPWAIQSRCVTFCLLGHPDIALLMLPEAMAMVHGVGYISETPLDTSGGVSTYPPASGSWLSLIMTMLAYGSQWDDEVQVGVALPRLWRLRHLRFRNVATINGARVSGTYEPTRCEYIVDCPRPMTLRALLPRRIVGEPLAITRNDAPVEHRCDGDYLCLPLAAGRNVIRVERDWSAPAEVLIIEPHTAGCELAQLIAAAGWRVRLVREFDAALGWMTSARVILLHPSFATPPDDTVDALVRAVRAGATALTQFHAACLAISPELAELTGVRARITSQYWDEPSRLHTFELTPAGRALFPDLPVVTRVPCMMDVVADLLPDVEVLAVEQGTTTPALTRRRVGRGWVYWYAPGSHMMDRNMAQHGGWDSMARVTRVHGLDLEARWSNPHWLRAPDFQQTIRAILRLVLGAT